MSRKCEICGKGPMVTMAVSRTGSKLRSGKKRYITSRTKRRQLPNLHKVKMNVNGTIKRLRVCTSCLSSHKVQKVV